LISEAKPRSYSLPTFSEDALMSQTIQNIYLGNIHGDMKSVVHISTRDLVGGAAIAAWRLHEGMQCLGIDSRVISRYGTSGSPEVSCVSTPLFAATDLLQRTHVSPAQPEGATFFSLTPVSIPLLDHPWIAAADVVHLHWVADFLAPEDILELCNAGKTVFWTFHDQWPYTGGCHYIGGSTREECDWDGTAQISPAIHSLARMEFLRKKQAFRNASIHVIAPSRWMAEEAAASGVFAPECIHVVPYGINTSIFNLSTVEDEINLLGDDHVRLLFGCQYLGDRRKGFIELRQALTLCMSDSRFAKVVEEGRVSMTTFGGMMESGLDLPIPVTHLGMLVGEKEVADILRSSSAFICPTLEDNLPNVVMESLACGCPVIAFATGGVPDMVEHQKNGLLAPKGNIEALTRCLSDFCLDGALRQNLRNGAKSICPVSHSLETQASRILELYETVSPKSARIDSVKISKNLPSITLNAKILPHFGTVMTEVLLRERANQEALFSASMGELNGKLLSAWEHAAQSEKWSQQQINQLQLSNHEIQLSSHGLQLSIKALKSKLTHVAQKRENLEVKIKALKNEIQTLKKLTHKKSFLTRFRHYLSRRLKRFFVRNV
jgi:glycosyltransferase involved in cell wall biosynthesis